MNDLALKPTDSKQRARLPMLPLTWEATTYPEPPVPLPVKATVAIADGTIEIHTEKYSYGDYEEQHFAFDKSQIVAAEILLRPDPERPWTAGMNERSLATFRHIDPYGVVPYFEETFSSEKSYYMRALAKWLNDRLGIQALVRDEDPNDIPF